MNDVTGLLVVILVSMMGRTGGAGANNGYCIGNQCFGMIQDPSDFTTAQDQCKDKGGHLMTVRSSVSHDILSILLGNFTGRFWIGLHLKTACPDAAAGLKGFQWVTEDSESDFFNWAPSFDSSCSSPRCVSVSKESDFKWTQEPCGEQAAGFLCEYGLIQPCKNLEVAQDESVTYMTPMGFKVEDVLSLPMGTIATRMPSETKYLCFSEKWLKAPWNCEIQEGGCEHKCAMDPNEVPSCYCPPGQIVSPENKVTCEEATDDPCLALRCDHACYRSDGSYACVCDHGYKLAQDGRSCVDFNDCTDERQCPGENFKCKNTIGGFQCVCEDGYVKSGSLCVDDNECLSAPCEHECHNTPGSYNCSCFEGYKVDPKSPNKCKRHCGKEECAAECDPNDASQCYCPDGYVAEEREDHTVCIEIDECISNYCDQQCTNTFGSYVCSCSPGYTLVNQYNCVKNEDHTDGSQDSTTAPDFPTTSYIPGPTRQPSGVSVGAFVGIILCTVFLIVLVVFLAHHILSRRGKMESSGALKAQEGEAHGLHRVATDA
ncbi:thrombomodulin-like [Seriola lalandi dorsalis]|uniref:thrombomodulin-like n=1 Tax=Seriola lalandi dorsalis TaxID=1841481 RepID=UPI000C6F8406|nr:thrombomodulin-like [Seriola lalandi dorsalis]XP_056261322.1 thrombomodulin [Seriola aureovittata]